MNFWILRLRWSLYKLNKASKKLQMEKALTKLIKENDWVNIFNYPFIRLYYKLGGRF